MNILGIHHEELSNFYADAKTSLDNEKSHYAALFSDTFTAPRLNDCIASFAFQITKQYDGGDHWIVVGEVMEMYKNENTPEPLLFFGGKYHYPQTAEAELIKPAADLYK